MRASVPEAATDTPNGKRTESTTAKTDARINGLPSAVTMLKWAIGTLLTAIGLACTATFSVLRLSG